MLLFYKLRYSFPVRLLVLHFRSHLVLVSLWVFLGLLVTGQAGRFFGLHYLLLTPEYRGEVGFWSFFLTGAAFGVLVMIWNLTTYLLCANRFGFLATLSAPFTKFSLNNSLIPLAFFGVYVGAGVWFQAHDEFTSTTEIVRNTGAFLLGFVAFVLLLATYLQLTNKDIAAFLRPGVFVPRPGGRLLVPGQHIPTLSEIRAGATRWRVDTYLTERGHLRLVRSVAHYNPALLARVFRQNHFNAVVVQAAALLLLMLQGWLMDTEWLRFPTSVSIFVLVSMAISMFGAVVFWFRHWGTLVFFVVLLLVNFLTSKGYFHYRNQAYGVNYAADRRPVYDYALLDQLASDSLVQVDKAATERTLNRWLERQPAHPRGQKPKMVLVCVSGGGHRAALWAVRCLQQADRALQGDLLRQTVLVTGASGGMLGVASLREVMLRQAHGEAVSVHDSTLFDDLGRDLLNPVTASLVSNDLFYPLNTFEQAGQTYRKDRGYYFERQLADNLHGYLAGKRLADYAQPEADAVVPMLVLSPYIINDSRRLLISPQGISYLSRPPDALRQHLQMEVDGVDFRRLFATQQADSLSFTSALRMNCTFPFILPNTWLPTRPALEIMDAGARDNFGITGAARFVQVFRPWIEAHTSGVVVIQIRCWEKVSTIDASDEKGIVDNLFTPMGAITGMTISQDFDHDNYLSMLDELMGGGHLQLIRFTYRPVRQQRSASLSFHLSAREKIDIRESFGQPENQAALRQLEEALR